MLRFNGGSCTTILSRSKLHMCSMFRSRVESLHVASAFDDEFPDLNPKFTSESERSAAEITSHIHLILVLLAPFAWIFIRLAWTLVRHSKYGRRSRARFARATSPADQSAGKSDDRQVSGIGDERCTTHLLGQHIVGLLSQLDTRLSRLDKTVAPFGIQNLTREASSQSHFRRR